MLRFSNVLKKRKPIPTSAFFGKNIIEDNPIMLYIFL
tara:strand:- start:320 stop:430 length:111 start_codon:yes stop_codon:yes gene_type:complete